MAITASRAAARTAERRFWLAMALILACLTFWGFGGSFFLRGILPHQPSHIDGPDRWLYALHGLAFGTWLILLVSQAGLVTAGRTDLHRRLGMASLLVLPLIVATGVGVALHAARHGFHVPGVAAPVLVMVAVLGLAFFAAVVGLALGLRHRPAAHKRLMLIATMMVAGAGTTRIPQVAALGLAPFDPTQLLLLPMLWWDWHSLGRIHPATLWGGLALLAVNTAMEPLGSLPAWHALLAPITG